MTGQLVRVASLADLPPGGTILVQHHVLGTDDDIVLARDEDGTVHALDDTCTHFIASLAAGRIVDGCLECPAHAARFDLITGRETSSAAYRPVTVHRVVVHDNQIFVQATQPTG
jgi:3-phenylpropionate/trans-cinnamate dioxygenase ferredoxin subunit